MDINEREIANVYSSRGIVELYYSTHYILLEEFGPTRIWVSSLSLIVLSS